jgi:cytochrome-b5 reductase
MDWMKLSNRLGRKLAGVRFKLTGNRYTTEEVAAHDGKVGGEEGAGSRGDMWTTIRGKVFNLSPYLPFHPGGARILASVAGKDGTLLFDQHHPYVQLDPMMTHCVVGMLAPAGSASGGGGRAKRAAVTAKEEPSPLPAALITAGSTVQIHGLKSAAASVNNGRKGTVLRFDAGKGRYLVQLSEDDGETKQPEQQQQQQQQLAPSKLGVRAKNLAVCGAPLHAATSQSHHTISTTH